MLSVRRLYNVFRLRKIRRADDKRLLVTLISAALILAITTMEFFDYRRVTVDTSIKVDKSRGERLTVKLNLTFPRVPCYREIPLCSIRHFWYAKRLFYAVLSLDVMDISGETQADISHNIVKTRLTDAGLPMAGSQTAELRNDLDKINEQRQNGYCGSCYGGVEPEGGCCNSCEDVRQAYVNRGWSFSQPEAIEQVRPSSLARLREVSVEGLVGHDNSASRRAGRRS